MDRCQECSDRTTGGDPARFPARCISDFGAPGRDCFKFFCRRCSLYVGSHHKCRATPYIAPPTAVCEALKFVPGRTRL